VILKCLEKDRNLRYQHASQVSHDLGRLESDPAPKIRLPRRRWPVTVAALIAAACVGSYLYVHKTPSASVVRNTLVLADVENTTGDPALNHALRQGLALELQKSQSLSSSRTIASATRWGASESSRLGSQYALGLRARNCQTGEILAGEQAQASGKEEVVASLGPAAATLAKLIEQSLSKVQKPAPLEEATTSSLEALRSFSTAMKVNSATGQAAAVGHHHRAIALDPQFATAFAYLGLAYYNVGQTELAAESTRRAYELRERASDLEKLFITYTYDRQVTGNLERALETLELWAQTDPLDFNRMA
jgi:eukaryotic-like serine/threonine-protein kinase